MIYSRITALVVLLCLASIAHGPVFADETDVYAAIDSFTWKEFDDDGSRLLKESGTLIGVGVTYLREFDSHLTLKPTAELFGGRVNYDGHTQSGIPATSKVDYFGIKLEVDLGRRFTPAQGLYVEPFGGLGCRIWNRDIKNGTTPTGSAVNGYMEGWRTLYARLGLRGGKDFSQATRLFAEAGIKLPLYNENTAYLSDAGLGSDVTLHPGKQSSLFWEAGVKIDRFKGSVFYDGMRFSRSANVPVSGGYAFQPQSTSDIYGIKLGISF
jgi:hypothetical protein